MAQTCTKCSRSNPADAAYCYYDGSLLEGHSQNGGAMKGGMQSFPSQFVFPNGLVCRNFDQLAQACQENWPQACDLLQQGYLENFLGGLGRADLAFAAREASRFPDRDRGLDQLLAKLPSQVLEAPKLKAEPREVNLGVIDVGTNRQLELHLANNGSRLLYGTVTSDDCKWLTLGDAPGAPSKVFQFGHELVIPIQVRGANLRAGNKPLEGKLLVESNGGTTAVVVRCEVPVKPFPDGALAGAKSPRQIAEKAKAAPKEAAVLFEKGAVADWYKLNGWTYPVQGPSAAGLGAVQQFFEALGLTAPPKVDINERFINFHGDVGQNLKRTVEVKAVEKRPVFAHATSDQPWLVAERAQLNGRIAVIAITVPSVPNRPGEVLQGRVTITSNGNQRFVVPVTLNVSGTFAQPVIMEPEVLAPVFADLASPAPVMAMPTMGAFAGRSSKSPATMAGIMMPEPIAMAAEPIAYRKAGRQKPIWIHLIPLFIIVGGLVGMVIHDLLVEAAPHDFPVYPSPKVQVNFLTGSFTFKGQEDRKVAGSLRFGVVVPDEPDPRGKLPENPSGKKRLTFFPDGASNNTCLRIDNQESLIGSPPTQGEWIKPNISLGAAHDGPNKEPRKRQGRKSIFYYLDDKIRVTQIVEVVPNQESADVKYKGKIQEMRLLDTVLVQYIIENTDTRKHEVGIRFLLDTFIGAEDGVPFSIPGKTKLCTTKDEFDEDKKMEIPDFIQALERPDFENPGTVARVTLKVPGLEAPSRVVLGAWPHKSLQARDPRAKQHMTMWEVPYLDMRWEGNKDSAVTMYWKEKPLKPKESRKVGFAYGLGDIAASGGRIGLSTSRFVQTAEPFTVTAEISDPKPGDTVTIDLPDDLELVDDNKKQAVQVAPDAQVNRSLVTWRVTAKKPGKKKITVRMSTGDSQTKPVTVKSSKAGIFG